MYRFTRTAIVKNAAVIPAAVQWGAEVTAYLNRTYSMNMTCGVQLYGSATMQWQFEMDSLEKIGALYAKLLQDREYVGILEKAKDLWVEGSMNDSVVALVP